MFSAVGLSGIILPLVTSANFQNWRLLFILPSIPAGQNVCSLCRAVSIPRLSRMFFSLMPPLLG